MTALPTELLLMIFDIVIAEGIISLNQCDHTTFPYIQAILPSQKCHHRFYDSYWRLRLVRRSFNAILGDSPSHTLDHSSIFPLPITTKMLVLHLEASPVRLFERLLAEMSTCGRLVYLDVTCRLRESSDRSNFSNFLHASAGQTYCSVQRLTLRLLTGPSSGYEFSFWTRLHRAFPSLVTLVITEDPGFYGCWVPLELVAKEVVTFEKLKIIYLNSASLYSGCHFPRLLHASIQSPERLERKILPHSPYLESFLIQPPSFIPSSNVTCVDMTSCLRLKLLGFPDSNDTSVVPVEQDHPVEHIWLYAVTITNNRKLVKELSERLPGISRITVELPPASRWRRLNEFRDMELDSLRLNMRPIMDSDSHVVIERVPAVKSGI